jgi:hypothetical protein
MTRSKQIPEYDCSLKALFGDEATEILPILVPGARMLHDHNIEIDRSQLKADLVYNVMYRELPHILNMELQTDEDEDMHLRLLQYHTNLHAKYKKPVLSVVLYPFEEKVPVPPYREMSGDEELMVWKYRVIGLYNMVAEQFRRQQMFCMYSLLPAMKGVDAGMLIQTLQEMKQYYTPEAMKHHLDRFWKMLQKSITISKEDKSRVEEELRMQFDWFIDTVPEVIERVQQAEKRGEVKGKAEGLVEGEVRGVTKGELQALRQVTLTIVQDRFPDLMDFAQAEVSVIKQPALLHKLIRELHQASDEVAALRAFKMVKQ